MLLYTSLMTSLVASLLSGRAHALTCYCTGENCFKGPVSEECPDAAPLEVDHVRFKFLEKLDQDKLRLLFAGQLYQGAELAAFQKELKGFREDLDLAKFRDEQGIVNLQEITDVYLSFEPEKQALFENFLLKRFAKDDSKEDGLKSRDERGASRNVAHSEKPGGIRRMPSGDITSRLTDENIAHIEDGLVEVVRKIGGQEDRGKVGNSESLPEKGVLRMTRGDIKSRVTDEDLKNEEEGLEEVVARKEDRETVRNGEIVLEKIVTNGVVEDVSMKVYTGSEGAVEEKEIEMRANVLKENMIGTNSSNVLKDADENGNIEMTLKGEVASRVWVLDGDVIKRGKVIDGEDLSGIGDVVLEEASITRDELLDVEVTIMYESQQEEHSSVENAAVNTKDMLNVSRSLKKTVKDNGGVMNRSRVLEGMWTGGKVNSRGIRSETKAYCVKMTRPGSRLERLCGSKFATLYPAHVSDMQSGCQVISAVNNESAVCFCEGDKCNRSSRAGWWGGVWLSLGVGGVVWSVGEVFR